jgi:hypothetical protein
MTNGDKIRQMSNEELAKLLDGNCHYCEDYIFCDGDLKKCEQGCLEGIKAYLDMEIQE